MTREEYVSLYREILTAKVKEASGEEAVQEKAVPLDGEQADPDVDLGEGDEDTETEEAESNAREMNDDESILAG
jgi:hypothetical protein